MDLDPRFTRETYDADAVIFRAGDPGDAAYLVEAGRVEVVLRAQGKQRAPETLGPGAVFGEVALLDRLPRTGTVRTLEPTVLLRIERKVVDDLLRGTDPVIVYLLRLLLERLRRERQWAEEDEPAQAGPLPQALLPSGVTIAETASAPYAGGAAPDPLHASVLRTLSLSRDLSQAIAAGQLDLHYQPIFALGDGALAGFEALVRWNHPVQGLVSPDEFIPLAERTGLIRSLGHWVLARAVADWPTLRGLCDLAGPQPFVGVNLSPTELSTSGIGATILRCLREASMDPRELRIELTETAVIGNLAAVTDVTQALRRDGVGIALDDFGTGYAGLSYLQDLPFSCVKIDRAFVGQMLAAPRSMHIVKLALELSRLMDLTTVAEGIEDRATSDALRQLGCTHAQGYHLARPMPLPALLDWRRTAPR
jgi:diguanylate cyclase